MLRELARALEAEILAGDEYHSRPALEAISNDNFDDTLAALGAQAAIDPRAMLFAREMADRLERNQRESGVSQSVGRVVCGSRLCVTEQTVRGDERAASARRVGSGQTFMRPDGTGVSRIVYVAQRGIGHAAPTPRP